MNNSKLPFIGIRFMHSNPIVTINANSLNLWSPKKQEIEYRTWGNLDNPKLQFFLDEKKGLIAIDGSSNILGDFLLTIEPKLENDENKNHSNAKNDPFDKEARLFSFLTKYGCFWPASFLHETYRAIDLLRVIQRFRLVFDLIIALSNVSDDVPDFSDYKEILETSMKLLFFEDITIYDSPNHSKDSNPKYSSTTFKYWLCSPNPLKDLDDIDYYDDTDYHNLAYDDICIRGYYTYSKDIHDKVCRFSHNLNESSYPEYDEHKDPNSKITKVINLFFSYYYLHRDFTLSERKPFTLDDISDELKNTIISIGKELLSEELLWNLKDIKLCYDKDQVAYFEMNSLLTALYCELAFFDKSKTEYIKCAQCKKLIRISRRRCKPKKKFKKFCCLDCKNRFYVNNNRSIKLEQKIISIPDVELNPIIKNKLNMSDIETVRDLLENTESELKEKKINQLQIDSIKKYLEGKNLALPKRKKKHKETSNDTRSDIKPIDHKL